MTSAFSLYSSVRLASLQTISFDDFRAEFGTDAESEFDDEDEDEDEGTPNEERTEEAGAPVSADAFISGGNDFELERSTGFFVGRPRILGRYNAAYCCSHARAERFPHISPI